LIRVTAELGAVRELAQAVREAGVQARIGADALVDLELAVVEAANNIVIHGYGATSGAIEMRIVAGDGLQVELRDQGRPIPAEKLAESAAPFTLCEGGRGLAIIRSCVDRFDYRSEGGTNRLTLFKAGA
jgi:serine/threonine-protein kinase RsbW